MYKSDNARNESSAKPSERNMALFFFAPACANRSAAAVRLHLATKHRLAQTENCSPSARPHPFPPKCPTLFAQVPTPSSHDARQVPPSRPCRGNVAENTIIMWLQAISASLLASG